MLTTSDDGFDYQAHFMHVYTTVESNLCIIYRSVSGW